MIPEYQPSREPAFSRDPVIIAIENFEWITHSLHQGMSPHEIANGSAGFLNAIQIVADWNITIHFNLTTSRPIAPEKNLLQAAVGYWRAGYLKAGMLTAIEQLSRCVAQGFNIKRLEVFVTANAEHLAHYEVIFHALAVISKCAEMGNI